MRLRRAGCGVRGVGWGGVGCLCRTCRPVASAKSHRQPGSQLCARTACHPTRSAAPGGMGGTKCAGNYSPVLVTQVWGPCCFVPAVAWGPWAPQACRLLAICLLCSTRCSGPSLAARLPARLPTGRCLPFNPM